VSDRQTKTSNDALRGWVWIATALIIAGALGVLAYALVARHERETRRRELELQQERLAEEKRAEARRFVQGVIKDYLVLRSDDVRRRDRTLQLIAKATDDSSIKQWAEEQRKSIAAELKRLELTEQARYTPQPGEPPPGTTFADQGKVPEQEEKDSAEWKSYLKARDGLRLARGKYCCKITTGKILFTRASSGEQCRQRTQELCVSLAKAAGEKQKCFYVLSSDCAAGEILAGGDVDAEP